jgi:hypothetical protein
MEARLEVELRELSVPECFALLATATMGHLAVTFKALPVVVPVRIHLVGDEFAIESLLGRAIPLTTGAVVALEAGATDHGLPAEWTVEVRGYLTARSDDVEPARRSRFAADDGEFRLSTEEVSGWRPVLGGANERSSLPASA